MAVVWSLSRSYSFLKADELHLSRKFPFLPRHCKLVCALHMSPRSRIRKLWSYVLNCHWFLTHYLESAVSLLSWKMTRDWIFPTRYITHLWYSDISSWWDFLVHVLGYYPQLQPLYLHITSDAYIDNIAQHPIMWAWHINNLLLTASDIILD